MSDCQAALAEDLGERALGAAAEQLELDQPVLRDRVADAEPGVVGRPRVHVRDAVGVARDRHAGAAATPSCPGWSKPAGLKAKRLEQRDLVVQVRVGVPDGGHEARLAGRQHRLAR